MLRSSTTPTLMALSGILIITVFIVDIRVPLGIAMGALYLPSILLAILTGRIRVITIYAGVTCILTVSALIIKPPVAEMSKALANRGISVFIIIVTTLLGIQLIRESRAKDRAPEQIRVLHGILPICSSCKKIRNDHGSWVQLEAYITEHSEASFSHGICPDCTKKLYPDLKI